MASYSVEKEYQGLLDAYGKVGGNRNALLSKDVANLVIHQNRVLTASEVEGVRLKYEPKENGVDVELLVEEGIKVKHPVHLCFGILPQEGLQDIGFRVDVGKGAKVSVIAHCIFPNAVHIIHRMDAVINVGDSASFSYKETHYHGTLGGIEVIAKAKVMLAEKALYENTFSLVEGRVGKLNIDYDIFCGARSVTELITKVYGKEDDIIKLIEKVHLNGDGARSLMKTRVVPTDRAWSEVVGETYGNAAYARGHMDCMEVVIGEQAVARAIPLVVVTNAKAKVTHEAAIGSVDKKQIETLMARGLDEDEAIDIIVKGILR